MASSSASAAPGPEAPPSPFAVALDSKEPLFVAGVEGGLLVADGPRTKLGRVIGEGGAVTASAMPEGLPATGRIVRLAGRAHGAAWMVFERAEGKKPEATPFFRLGKDAKEWKSFADDWSPLVTPWTKNRVLAVSTSSGKLKIKVVEPTSPKPPEDLPSPGVDDPACEKSLVLHEVAAAPSGELFGAGNCKPDTAAGAGASSMRYVVVRWALASPDAGAPSPAAPTAQPTDAGSITGAGASASPDAGEPPPDPAPPVSRDRLGTAFVMPGASVSLSHGALFVASASDAYAIATDPKGTPKAGAHLFHFDGATWGVEALPPAMGTPRSLTGSPDGVLWIAAEHGLWQRPAGEAWREVPPPERGLPNGPGVWQTLGVFSVGKDVWVWSRRTAGGAARDLLSRLGEARPAVRWD